MIDYSEIRRIVETKINSDFTDLPVEFENTFIDPPDSEHVKVTTTETRSVGLDITGPGRLVEGDVIIQIYVSIGSGTDKARQAASSLHDMLYGENSETSVYFKGEAELISIGRYNESPLYQYNLIIPYMYVYGQ